MKKRILSIILAATMTMSLAAGITVNAEENTSASGYNGEEVSITVFNEWVGSHSFAGYFEKRLAEFREAYPNIQVNVEEIAGSSTMNMDAKLKVQISSGELPDAFYTNDKGIIDLAKKADLLLDMKPMLDNDAEFTSDLDMDDIALWNDGTDNIYGICSSKDVFGYFYNKDFLAQAGYDSFPTTWDDFYALCDKLVEMGIAPMSLETKTAWISSLSLLAPLAGQSEAGYTMANTLSVTDYNTSDFIDAAAQLQKMFTEYSTLDAAGADCSIAVNNFASTNTAMLLDGAWRITELKESAVGENLDVAMLPGNGMIDYAGYAWFSGSQDETKAAAAYEFIKWMSNRDDQTARLEMLGLIPASTNIDYSTLELDDLMLKILEMKEQEEYKALSCWRIYPAAVTAIIPQELAALATGQNTPEQFADNLTRASE